MARYKFRSLPRDVARCEGANCKQRKNCARHTQIKLDEEHSTEAMQFAYLVYTDASRNDAESCELMIGEM